MAAPMQFISCTVTECPMNQEKQCRAPLITVDEEGFCTVKEAGPHKGKAQVENYVEIKVCDCSECDAWEEDLDVSPDPVGKCGFGDSLKFAGRSTPDKVFDEKVDELKAGKPKCLIFDGQVGQPGFSATL